MKIFRSDSVKRDVWVNLERNWIDFFWLTGETPPTLNDLVLKLERRFHPFVHCGCRNLLDFKNQVCIQ